MFINLLTCLFATICSAIVYNYKSLILLQSSTEIATRKAINLTLSGQVEFRRFLNDALHGCRNANENIELNCPRKTLLNMFTHVCCDQDNNFMYLIINRVKIGMDGTKSILNLLNTRISDSFEFTNEINYPNERVLIFNSNQNNTPTLVRTYPADEYFKFQDLIFRHADLCMLENTQATESEACPRVYATEGLKFCCDYSDQLLHLKLGRMLLTRFDVDYLVNAMRRV